MAEDTKLEIMKKYAIIHISDIECGIHNRAHREDVEKSYLRCADHLIGDVQNMINEHPGIEGAHLGLVITGDLTKSASRDEFDDVKNVITHIARSLNIAKNHIAMIPGNHDVSWPECKKAFVSKYPSLNPQMKKDRERARTLGEKHFLFGALLKEVCGIDWPGPGSQLFFKGFTDIGLLLIGYDTTFPCTFCSKDNYGLLFDRKMSTSLPKEAEALRRQTPSLIPMAIMHHCPYPLREGNDKDNSYLHNASESMEMMKKAGIKAVLCGHEHRSRSMMDLAKGLPVLVTGSYGLNAQALLNRYGTSYKAESNKYQILVLGDNGSCKIRLRKLAISGNLDSPWEEDTTYEGSGSLINLLPQAETAKQRSESGKNIQIIAGAPRMLSGGYRLLNVRIGAEPEVLDSIKSVRYDLHDISREATRKEMSFFTDIRVPPHVDATIKAHIQFHSGKKYVQEDVRQLTL